MARPPRAAGTGAVTTLVTGASGYLGAALLSRLAGTGAVALVRPSTDRAALAAGAPRRVVEHPGTTAALVDVFRQLRPSLVYHLAAVYRREHQPDDVERLVAANVLLGAQVAEAMHRAGGGALVNVGSAFQTYDSADYRPLNLYAATKQAGEDILRYYQDAGLVRVVTLRLADVYGPDDPRPRLVAAIAAAQHGGPPLALPDDPEVPVDLVHVDDVVAALLHAGDLLVGGGADVAGGVFAVGSSRPCTLRDVVAAAEEATGRTVPIAAEPYPLPSRHPRRAAAGTRLPGWEPQVGLVEGLRSALGTVPEGLRS